MATAKKKTVSNIILDLSEDEAKTLRAVCYRTGGDIYASPLCLSTGAYGTYSGCSGVSWY
jgi:hypothetical protein